MRVLLDENLDVRLKSLFDPSFQVVTVRDRRWRGIKNGALLRDAEAEFDVLVTMDKKLNIHLGISFDTSRKALLRARITTIPSRLLLRSC